MRPERKIHRYVSRGTEMSNKKESQGLQILAIIPARGSSKGLANKNVLPLWGKPLITHTIEAALASSYRPRVIVTTDNEEIARIARDAGAQVPFMRPQTLAQDTTPMLPVVRHALERLRRNEQYRPELIVLLQPTSPLRRVQHIDAAIGLALEPGTDSVVSVCEAEHPPCWMLTLDERGMLRRLVMPGCSLTRRQDMPGIYRLNGAITVTRPQTIRQGKLMGSRSRALVMDRKESVDIDDELDFLLAETLLGRTRRIR